MDAVVLVGGFGTRLRPLTLSRPKQMVPVAHRPMIEHVLAHLASHGVDRAVLALGYRPDAFRDAYPDGTCAGVELVYAIEDEPLDTAGAVRFAATEAGLSDTFLVANGDVMTDHDFGALVDLHRSSGARATITLTPVDDPSRFGVVPTDPDGRVQGFIEKPPRESAPTNWINAGTYVFEPEVLDAIPADRPVSVERETFPALVEEGVMFARQDDAYWIDAGTPESYVRANLDLVSGARATRLDAVAADVEVAADAQVSDAVVMAGAVIETGARVERAVIQPGARVGAGATVVGSVVGARAVVGAGARLVDLTVVGESERVADGAELVGERVPAPDA